MRKDEAAGAAMQNGRRYFGFYSENGVAVDSCKQYLIVIYELCMM